MTALNDVTFEIAAGEVLGIIGRNGAEVHAVESARAYYGTIVGPDRDVRTRCQFAQVGTGFHPELTGRENIYLNGAIMGMTRAEIRRKFDEIVAYPEVETFIDPPVKHFSSSMYLRLAFAVAAHLDPRSCSSTKCWRWATPASSASVSTRWKTCDRRDAPCCLCRTTCPPSRVCARARSCSKTEAFRLMDHRMRRSVCILDRAQEQTRREWTDLSAAPGMRSFAYVRFMSVRRWADLREYRHPRAGRRRDGV